MKIQTIVRPIVRPIIQPIIQPVLLDKSPFEIVNGDSREVLAAMEPDSVDAIVTDPPYGIKFMNKKWDVPDVSFDPEFWALCLRVLKPGGHLVSFGACRTVHRIACAIEDAGFEIRDQLQWIFGSGFPKSLNISKAIDKAAGAEREVTLRHDPASNIYNGIPSGKCSACGRWNGSQPANCQCPRYSAPATPEAQQWEGWGTALKPAYEPIILARKPLIGTVAANMLAHGTGGLNIDACRVGDDLITAHGGGRKGERIYGGGEGMPAIERGENPHIGRWPPNILLEDVEEVTGLFPNSKTNPIRRGYAARAQKQDTVIGLSLGPREMKEKPGSEGSASRFFPRFKYAAKASRKEREAGCEHLPGKSGADAVNRKEGSAGSKSGAAGAGRSAKQVKNFHPTVKPVEVMRWLCRLITPPGGLVLDPFMGSGTTGIACMLEGFEFVGVDRDPAYIEIATARIEHALR